MTTGATETSTTPAVEHLGVRVAHSAPPGPPAAPLDEASALDHVRRLARSHYENFPVLSLLAPRAIRDDLAAVYAFCRWSDDLADETGASVESRARSSELLAWWRSQTAQCFEVAADRADASTLEHPVFVALAHTARRHHLDDQPFHDLISAFEQDQRVTRYDTWPQLLDYCRGSANPVGRIVLALGGFDPREQRNADLVRMSDATCTALQLANFWQDVRRDLFERDRVYLPRDLAGVDADTLRTWAARNGDGEARRRFAALLAPLCERTRDLFAQGRPLPAALDASAGGQLGRMVWLFGAGGELILTKVERAGYRTLWERPRLMKREKLALIARAALGLTPGAAA